MNELVCLDMTCGPQMVDRIRRAWDQGDAIFVLDQRLPLSLRQHLVLSVGPTIIATTNDEISMPGQAVEPGDLLVVTTSGTTGVPKHVIHTRDSLTASALATHDFLKITSDDKWLCCLPASHVGGFGVIARSILTDTPIIAVDSFSVEDFNNAAQQGATRTSLVPTAVLRVDTSIYTTVLVGGSQSPNPLPENCISTYGMTETNGGVAYNGIALNGVKFEVRDSLIYVKAPMLLRGFRDGSSPVTPDGWLNTGDIGQLSPEGKLQVQGRQGEMIITGGENVWPTLVERTLLTNEKIADVCVAGIPDKTWGQLVTAWVVLKPGQDLLLDELRDHVKASLASYCAPQRLILVDQIPRTALGKAQRDVLVAQITDDLS